MSGPISFPSTTANFSLPMLFAGQSQKEFFVNEALSLIDAVLQKTVIASQSAPPAEPNEGDTYRITSGASEWAGQDDALAIFIGESWHFIAPIAGTSVFDQSTGQVLHYSNGWNSAAIATNPEGGSVIDSQARIAITELIQSLQAVGIYV